MKHVILFSAAFATFACCQENPFFRLATTDDAGQTYVWSSLPLKTEALRPSDLGLYQLVDGVITRVWSSAGARREPVGIAVTGFENLHVSGGGKAIVWTEVTRCTGGSRCMLWPPVSGVASFILRAGMHRPEEIPGRVQISRNGRYLLQFSARETVLRDLETDSRWAVSVKPLEVGHAVTSDGRVLGLSASDDKRLALWSPDHTNTLADLAHPVAEAVVSDNGLVAVFRTADGMLYRVRTDQPANRELIGIGTAMTLSNDGELGLFVRDKECLITRRGSPHLNRLPTPARVHLCKLVGFGTAAVAVTERAQVLRIELSVPDRITELIPSTPYGFLGGSLAPGAVLAWSGYGLVRLLLNGSPLPVIRDDPGDLWFQAPFDLPVGGPAQTLEIETGSPFGGPPRSMTVEPRAPRFLSGTGSFFSDGFVLASHQDFGSPVTRENPARPGEVVHLWAVSLGAVSPGIEAGQPAPTSTLLQLVDPFECRTLRGENVPVVFAGLAPGLTGIYQVDVQIPSTLVDEHFRFECGPLGESAQRVRGWLPMTWG